MRMRRKHSLDLCEISFRVEDDLTAIFIENAKSVSRKI